MRVKNTEFWHKAKSKEDNEYWAKAKVKARKKEKDEEGRKVFFFNRIEEDYQKEEYFVSSQDIFTTKNEYVGSKLKFQETKKKELEKKINYSSLSDRVKIIGYCPFIMAS